MKDACEEGSFHFYCKPATLMKLMKILSYVFFPDFATTQSNLFEIIGNGKNTYLPECLRMAAYAKFYVLNESNLIYFYIDVFQKCKIILSN